MKFQKVKLFGVLLMAFSPLTMAEVGGIGTDSGYTLEDVSNLQSKIAFKKGQAELQKIEESMEVKPAPGQVTQNGGAQYDIPMGGGAANSQPSDNGLLAPLDSNKKDVSKSVDEVIDDSIVVHNVYGDKGEMFAEIVFNDSKMLVRKGDRLGGSHEYEIVNINTNGFSYVKIKPSKKAVKKTKEAEPVVVTLPINGGDAFNGLKGANNTDKMPSVAVPAITPVGAGALHTIESYAPNASPNNIYPR